jgi:hypothetical protein
VLWLWCVYLKLMLAFDHHGDVLRLWKLNLTSTLRGGAFGNWVGLDKAIRVELSWLNPGGFIWERERKREDTHMSTPASYYRMLYCLKTPSAGRPTPYAAPWHWTRTLSQKASFLYNLTQCVVLCVSNRNWIY